MPGVLYSGLQLTLSLSGCRRFSKGSFIDLYLISLQYSNSASVLQSGAVFSTPPKLPKFVSVCMCVGTYMCERLCVCVCAQRCINMQEKVPELYQTNSFSHWPGFNNAEFVPQSFNSSSTSLSLIQSPLLWLKQKPYLV